MAKKTWTSNISDIALMYGLPEADIEQRMYALAEHIHFHYCLSRGIVNHHEMRPDQDVALSILGALAGTDWFLMHGEDRIGLGTLEVGGIIDLEPGEIIVTREPNDQT